MGIISVILAAAAAWIFGAVWYGVIGTRWMEAQGLTEETIDRSNPVPYIGSFLCCIVVAGMTRHVLAMSGIDTVGKAAITGLGLGLFIAAPWIATNVLFSNKSKSLIWMDGVYPAAGMTLMGIVLGIFY
ncbi:DUF1761 domain-containing protein [Psychromarinibacter sp. S121]|uniref:DUF1761 domain-containing protein n=1 Tax=Psychromarinibacter sp. S121 TaxID=3415127 RepID=UPI003C7BE337